MEVFAVNCSSIFTPFLHTSLEVAQWNCCINWFCLKNIHDLTKDENCNCWFYRSISRVVILMSFRFLQLVVAHPAFSKVEDLKKFLKEEKVSISNNPCKCGWFSPKICKVTYYGETTLDFNSIAGVFGSLKVSGKPDQKLSIKNDHDISFCHSVTNEARLRNRASIFQSSLHFSIEPPFSNRASIFQSSLHFPIEPPFFNRASFL